MIEHVIPLEDLDFTEWNTPKEIALLENFGMSIFYRGKIYDQIEWENSDEKKEYDSRNKHSNRNHYRNKELPSQIDPNYKQKQIMNEYKLLIDKVLNKPVEKTVYIDNSRRTKISIF
jgi:hypothetical protein